MGFFNRLGCGNDDCGCNDTVLWFIILFLLLFWCNRGDDCCCDN